MIPWRPILFEDRILPEPTATLPLGEIGGLAENEKLGRFVFTMDHALPP
jgi:hypothetical protein